MLSMATPHTIGVRAYSSTGTDAHGNPQQAWAPAVQVPVYGIAPASSQEPGADRDAVTDTLVIYAPPGTVVGPHDRVVIDGAEYEVVGEMGDYTKGPFWPDAGTTINVTRSRG